MAVVKVCVGDDVHELARFQPAHLREHDEEHGVLHDVPIVGGEHIVGALIEDAVERIARDVEGHGVRARVEVHLVQVLKVIQVGEDAAGSGVVLQIVEHPVDLIELPSL